MTLNDIYIYYQYSNCIVKTKGLINFSLKTNKFDPIKCAELQLLTISLNNNDNDIFLTIKFILNIIGSYLAAFSQSGISESDLELLIEIDFVLYLLSYILSYSYQELAIANNQDFSVSEIDYILNNPPSLDTLNSSLKINFYESSIEDKYTFLNLIKNSPIYEWSSINK
jgi:hypothetical protein